jgi:hypothetical protein
MRDVISSFRGSICALILAAACAAPLDAQRWQRQYQYDEEKSTLMIGDMQFPSASRGVAVGMIRDAKDRGREKPVGLITTDGGAHWQQMPLPENPVSLFFLNEGSGWMVTEKGLWYTSEAGKNWRKLPKPPSPLFRVYFTSEKDGWAVGPKKAAFETHDAGEHWKPLAVAAETPGDKEFSAYNWISFPTSKFGFISGWNQPRRRFGISLWPDWMDPEAAVTRRELPHLAYSLVTSDGGTTWKSTSASVFGVMTRARFNASGVGFGLLQYEGSFRYPSEVYRIDWASGKSSTIYRNASIDVTDIWVTADGTLYLAGYALPGKLRSVVPGKVMVLQSRDYSTFTEMPVDYRATATHAVLAGADDKSVWLATDTGMILKLAP